MLHLAPPLCSICDRPIRGRCIRTPDEYTCLECARILLAVLRRLQRRQQATDTARRIRELEHTIETVASKADDPPGRRGTGQDPQRRRK